ncbi:hypothetical protein [Saccharopolyspora pogona]|uniref:hypothetical protein n=1 Tax=Saccharopolyspora pogona TaxID=333966 RepID=UPI001688599F|nr:hypothetical protein [Saccharopolyspora pogona]
MRPAGHGVVAGFGDVDLAAFPAATALGRKPGIGGIGGADPFSAGREVFLLPQATSCPLLLMVRWYCLIHTVRGMTAAGISRRHTGAWSP